MHLCYECASCVHRPPACYCMPCKAAASQCTSSLLFHMSQLFSQVRALRCHENLKGLQLLMLKALENHYICDPVCCRQPRLVIGQTGRPSSWVLPHDPPSHATGSVLLNCCCLPVTEYSRGSRWLAGAIKALSVILLRAKALYINICSTRF